MSKSLLSLSFLLLLFVAFFLGSCSKAKSRKIKSNPLIAAIYDTPDGVPPFDKIKTKDYLPAFKYAMKLHNKEILHIIHNLHKPTFENTIVALDQSGAVLENVSNIFFNLNEANSNPQMQKIAEQISPLLSAHYDKIYMNQKLFRRVKAVYDKRDKLHLSTADSMLLEKIYKRFVRNGALLSKKDRNRLMEINKKLSLLSLKFGQHVLAEVNRYNLIVSDSADLAGLPKNLIEQAAQIAERNGDSGKWYFKINRSMITPFLTYAKNRALREKIFKAYISKGDHNDSLDNKAIVNEMVNLRLEKARLLHYKYWAAYQLADRMEKKPWDVIYTMNKIWDKALEAAKNEAQELQKIIYQQGDTFKLQPWDWWYYAEILRQKKYNLDENQLRQYFVLKNVLEKGAFYTANRLYGLTFRRAKKLPVYHPDVMVYEVWQGTDSLLGVLYLDFYARDSKRGGAWTTIFRPEYYKNGKRVPPVVSIVCNFNKPAPGQPALLSLEEVHTLFHEFGHALHELLSNVPYKTISGTNVPLDFVEFPSQLMEEWATAPQVLRVYAKHYKTGQFIPQNLIEQIQNAKYFNQGFATVEYMAAAYLDLKWHMILKHKDFDVNKFEQEQMKRIHLIPQIVERYRSTYFNHIFAGGYSAGYYSYLWADILVQDAFDYFRQEGIFNQQLAAKLRHILEEGGAEDAMKLYVEFRGHKPDVMPLLRARGFVK